ncbi:MAG: hypothetical protein EKK53_05010 [Burkholderiales bacterium]|nr:MAG: hypothetical protein EKK53_05010 [Burkholderiales bacterium]
MLYDIRTAGVDTSLLWGLSAVLAAIAMFLAVAYPRTDRRRAPRVLPGALLAISAAVLGGTGWNGFARRADCVAALDEGRYDTVVGPLESVERINVPGKFSLQEMRFTVGGRTFVEPHQLSGVCGLARRFTDTKAPALGTPLRVLYVGEAVVQVQRDTGEPR